MRYLVGFVMAVSVLVFYACAGGECGEPSDVGGVWEITATGISDSCNDPVSYTFPLTIAQDGNAVSGETPIGALTGTVCGERIHMSGAVPPLLGWSAPKIADLQLTVSEDGNSLEGSDTWTWTPGIDRCEGSESLNGTRADDDVCYWGLDCPCQLPLDWYCRDSCPKYEQALDAAEQRAVQFGCGWCEGSGPAEYGAGRCGDWRYVEIDCGEEDILYFDSSGTLVAVDWWSDFCGEVCQGSCSVTYGFRPECAREQEQDFCDQVE